MRIIYSFREELPNYNIYYRIDNSEFKLCFTDCDKSKAWRKFIELNHLV